MDIDLDFDIDFSVPEKEKVSGSNTLESKIVKDAAIKRIIKNNEIHYIKAKALSDLCAPPKKNEQYRIITEKQFNAYALILHLLETKEIDEMYLAIYRINEPTVNSIIDFILSGKIKKSVFVISNFFNQTKKPEKWAIQLKTFCDQHPDRTSHVYTHNHSKILAIKSKSDYFVFEGSGNMSDNARIEQYLYENNKESFNFHKKWMINICNNG
jgi:hypothetical protein